MNSTLIDVMRRRWLIVVLSALVAAAVALGYSLTKPATYSATSSLLFLSGSNNSSTGSDPYRQAATNLQLLSLEAVAERTAAKLSRSVQDVRDHVTVESNGQSDVASVTATGDSRAGAAHLANSFAKEYITFRQTTTQNHLRDALASIDDQLSSLSPAARSGTEGRRLTQRRDDIKSRVAVPTTNALVVQSAQPELADTTGRPALAGILGLLVGGLIGLIIAFRLDRNDHRIRVPDEAASILDAPILGQVPSFRGSRGRARRAVSAVPSEAEAFRRLRANLLYAHPEGGVSPVLVTAAEEGAGVTTVAWNLAVAWSAIGKRVLYLDADLRDDRRKADSEAVEPERGLSTALTGSHDWQELLISPPGVPSTLFVLPAGPPVPQPADALDSDAARAIVDSARSAFDAVIIDAPSISTLSDAVPFVRVVSGLIVVARVGKSDRADLAALRDQLTALRANVLGVVVNGGRDRGLSPRASHATSRVSDLSPESA